MSDFNIDRVVLPEGTFLKITGSIDERFRPESFGQPTGVVVIDLAGVRMITSVGVREWRRALGRMQASALYFTGVTPATIAQFAMVWGFGGRGQILSFLAPYRCRDCGEETNRLIDRRRDGDVLAAEPPEGTCRCGGKTEFDDLVEYYRAALANTPSLDVVPQLETVLAASTRVCRR